MESQSEKVSRIFNVRDENLARFREGMTGLARRAARLGVVPPAYAIGAPSDVKVEGGRVERTWPVTVTGEAPCFAGWRFLATLQHVVLDIGAHATILRVVPGSSVAVPDRYRDAESGCDHCNVQRRRNDTYLLVHDSGRLRQVGSTCVRDFLGHDSPEDLAGMAELVRDAFELGEGGEGYGGESRRYSVEHYLGFVAASIREGGWVSRKMVRESYEPRTATADRAYSSMCRPDDRNSVVPDETDLARASEALRWAAGLHESGEALSEYMYNLNVAARCLLLVDGATGIVASMIPTYEREMGAARERAHAACSSAHVGTVGERIVVACSIVSIREIEGGYGVTHLHDMVDASGNRLKWFGASQSIGKAGDSVTIKGTVKKHDEYKGVRQTVLTRCALHVEKAPRTRARRVA